MRIGIDLRSLDAPTPGQQRYLLATGCRDGATRSCSPPYALSPELKLRLRLGLVMAPRPKPLLELALAAAVAVPRMTKHRRWCHSGG